MATRGVALTVSFQAWDTAANAPKTGDAANITMRWCKDNAASAALTTTTVTENDATNAPGIYTIGLSSTETDCKIGTVCGKSATASIVVSPVQITFVRLPDVAPAANGGLPTVNASNFIAGIAGTKNQLDDLTDITAAAVNTEVDTALSDIKLDHLLNVAALSTDVVTDSVIAQLAAKASPAVWTGFVPSTDSLEAIRDALTAAGVALTAQQVADALKLAPAAGAPAAGSAMEGILEVSTAPAAELAAVPAITVDLRTMVQFVYTALRNRIRTTATAVEIYKDDATTVLATGAITESPSSVIIGEMA